MLREQSNLYIYIYTYIYFLVSNSVLEPVYYSLLWPSCCVLCVLRPNWPQINESTCTLNLFSPHLVRQTFQHRSLLASKPADFIDKKLHFTSQNTRAASNMFRIVQLRSRYRGNIKEIRWDKLMNWLVCVCDSHVVCWLVMGSLASSPYMAYTVTVYSVAGVNPSSSTSFTSASTFTCAHTHTCTQHEGMCL